MPMGRLLPMRRKPADAALMEPRVPTFAAPRAASPNLSVVNLWPALGGTREALLSIPTALACRNLIVGSVVQMAIAKYKGTERVDPGRLLTQPDPDTTWAYMIGNTIEDLVLDGVAYWFVLATDGVETQRNPRGLPVRARWIPNSDVTPELDRDPSSYARLKGYRIAGVRQLVPPELVIRFDSPIPGVLVRGQQAIATALALEDKAYRTSNIDLPAGTLTNEGDPLSEEEADQYVQRFEEQRRKYGVGWLQDVSYEPHALNAKELQLVEARANSATEIARLFNMPVAMVSASPSGGASAMLYSNLDSQLALMVSGAVAPHLSTVEQTLSLPTVTAEGQRVAFDVQAFLRSDPATLAKYALDLYNKGEGVISLEEARQLLGIASGQNSLQPGTV